MNTIAMKLALLGALVPVSGCLISYDYTGEYDMTYDVVMSPAGFPAQAAVLAGLADVELREGQRDELLVDLGASFCLLTGTQEMATEVGQWPHIEIPPQDCWFTHGDKVYELNIGGTATVDTDDERLTIVLAGSYRDEDANIRGSLTIELTESW